MDAENGQVTMLKSDNSIVPVVVECRVLGYGMTTEYFGEKKHF